MLRVTISNAKSLKTCLEKLFFSPFNLLRIWVAASWNEALAQPSMAVYWLSLQKTTWL